MKLPIESLRDHLEQAARCACFVGIALGSARSSLKTMCEELKIGAREFRAFVREYPSA